MKDTIYRDKALDALDKEYRCTDQSDDWDGLKTAMLIIENLPSAQPSSSCAHENDTISRQAAIKVIDAVFPVDPMKSEYAQGIACGAALAKTYVEQLPSVQPEQAVKGCRNCKYGKYNDHWKTHFCYNPNECTEFNLWEPSTQPEWEYIDDQPTVELSEVQKTGHWIQKRDEYGDYYVCSVCGEELPRVSATPCTVSNPYPEMISIDKTDFCPNCGAYMRGEQNENGSFG